jgi:hypothetical protein
MIELTTKRVSSRRRADVLCEWGRADSNRRNPKVRDLQSLAIAAMRHPLRIGQKKMLEKGIEPSTVRLQVGCSTFELLQQILCYIYNKLLDYSQEFLEFFFNFLADLLF